MKTIADYLFATHALRVSDPEKPFWYASGTLGPFYVNTHFLIESEEKANELLEKIEKAAAGNRELFLQSILDFVKTQYETSESYKMVIDLIVEKAKELSFDFISGGERRDFFFSLKDGEEMVGPPATKIAGMSSLAAAISMPGTILSQLASMTRPSKACALHCASTVSAMISLEGRT